MSMDKEDYKDIRHQYHPISGILHVSVIDIIKILAVSKDPRNYWKTLKNRLKATHLELVTKCNQLKMRSSDGKMYLTDTLDSDNCLLLIQQISPTQTGNFRKVFNQLQDKNKVLEDTEIELSTDNKEAKEIKIDLYKKKGLLIIQTLLAGADKNDISIIASCKNILIQSKIIQTQNTEVANYSTKEISFGKYMREVVLPEEIEVDKIETFYNHGLLEIHLPIADKSYTKIIKIR